MKEPPNITNINVKYLPKGTYFGRCIALLEGSKDCLFYLKIEHITPFNGWNKYEKIKVKLNDTDAMSYFFNGGLLNENKFFYFKLDKNGIHSIYPIVGI